MIKTPDQSARPEKEDLHQGRPTRPGASGACIRPCLQAGNASRKPTRLAKKNNGAPGSDGGHLPRLSRTRRGVVPQAAPGRTGGTQVSSRCGIGGKRYPRATERSASWAYRASATAWSEEPSSSFWNQSSRLTSQPGSFGYRPQRTAHQAVQRVAEAIVKCKTRVVDIDLRAYFDNVRHDLLLQKVAVQTSDAHVLHLLKMILKASGKKGVPQGGVISPLLSNLYLNAVNKMLERAKETTRNGKYHVPGLRAYADDLVILVDAFPRHDWLLKAVDKRLRRKN